jgi:hypothetical protein
MTAAPRPPITKVSVRRANGPTMPVIKPPQTGEGVNILAPQTARLRGHVTARLNGTLWVELDQAGIRQPFHFTAGSVVEVEWMNLLGVMQVTAKVEEARAEPCPALRLELVGDPEPAERREHGRVAVELKVSAWSLAQPTRRLAGTTVDLSPGGALLWLPDLSPLAATIDVRIALPEEPLHASGNIAWRRNPGLVAVEFEHIDPREQACLMSFLREFR